MTENPAIQRRIEALAHNKPPVLLLPAQSSAVSTRPISPLKRAETAMQRNRNDAIISRDL
jgi:hypothetical protein